MGRQFSVVTTRSDMALLFDEVRSRGGQVAELWSSSPDPVVVQHVSGAGGVFLPPPDLLVLKRSYVEARAEWTTHELSSQVVTFSVGHGPDGVPRTKPAGRLSFSTVLGYEDEQPVAPDPAYVDWCEQLYAWAKRSWTLRDSCWFGPEAAATHHPEPVVTWVLAREAELSYGEAESAIAAWRGELALPDTSVRVRVADHGGYLAASIHVKRVVTS